MYSLVLFGGPGSGKGTQSELLVNEFGFLHISTGDLLRNEIRQESELGKIADALISKGQFVPDDLIISILEKVINQNSDAKGIIFDGFPRTLNQAMALNHILAKQGEKVARVIALEVADATLTERLLNRGKVSGRSDDNEITIANRLKVYHSVTKPLIEFYQNEGNYVGIRGEGTIEEIFSNIKAQIAL